VTDLHPRDRLLVARAWATFLGLGLSLHDARATRRALTSAWRSTAAAPAGRRPPTPQPACDSRCSIGLRFARRWLARTAAPVLRWRLTHLDSPSWSSRWRLAQSHRYLFAQTVRA
jgi:hypothetical protein